MTDTITAKSLLKGISKSKPRYEYHVYNEYQNFLYNRALFGLSVYSAEEVQVMHYDKKKRIIKVHTRAQTLLNLWKQQIVNVLSNHLFITFFPESPITKELLEKFGDVTDELHINKMSLRSLKIKKADVISRLIEEGILPRNFNELTSNQNESRIFSKREPDISAKPREYAGGRTVKDSG
jgi:hypothetical protein